MNLNLLRRLVMAGTMAVLAHGASAQVFDDGLPASWQCVGNCGVAEAKADVPLAPGGGSRYGWVSNYNGVAGVRLPGVGTIADSANGSLLRSHVFDAVAGQALTFEFNYVTTDGGDFSDYAWARLLNAQGSQVALLVTARTSPGGGAVPGFGMPPAVATLSRPFVNVLGTPPVWSPLGPDSGICYAQPCGVTGWVGAAYTIATGGSYYLEFGVTNWVDASADTGLAFDAIALDGLPLLPVPEPATWALLGGGLSVLALRRRS